MRKVLGRLVRRYIQATAAPLRAMSRDGDGEAAPPAPPPVASRPSLQDRLRAEEPIDLRPPTVELDAEVIDLDDAARDRDSDRRAQ